MRVSAILRGSAGTFFYSEARKNSRIKKFKNKNIYWEVRKVPALPRKVPVKRHPEAYGACGDFAGTFATSPQPFDDV